VAVLLSLVVLGGGGYGAWVGLEPVVAGLTEPDDFTGPGTGAVEVVVAPGDTGAAIGRTLQAAGVVKTAKAFRDAYDANPGAIGIQPGTYILRSAMSSAAAVTLLLDPTSRQVLKVTIPEGKRVAETLALLAKGREIPRKELVAAAKDAEALGLPRAAKGDPEGYLFPATYEFSPGVDAAEVLAAMVAQGTQAMDDLGVDPSDRRRLLIKASIVQAEAGRKAHMGKVARVVENRLAIDMKLAMDSTVNFATGKTGVTTTAADRATDSPYNTYKYAGLPAGPIDSPGLDALQAALDPTPGEWYYFVTVNPDTGETKFAKNSTEHAKNVAEFQAWLREHS
jgi:UPF0755 protein